MTRYLTLDEVLALHVESLARYGGSPGVHDLRLIESAIALPMQAFFGREAYPTLEEKAAILGFALTSNHGFRDGNKRVGFAAMDAYLRLNGYYLKASTDDAERISLGVASGSTTRDALANWVRSHTTPLATQTE